MPDTQPQEVLNRVLTVPDKYRVFSIPRDELRRKYGLDDNLVQTLLGLGLPHRGAGDDLRFDTLDLENMSAGLKLLSPQRVVLTRWSQTLNTALQEDHGAYELRISWTCPRPGHSGACRYMGDPQLLELMAAGTSELPAASTLTGLVEPQHEVHEFAPEFDQVVAAAHKMIFHRLPEGLIDDLGYLEETGLADCRLGNLHLMRIAQDLGMSVRPAAGFFVGAPFPALHVWFEVMAGDRWVPTDPFYLTTLDRWGIIDLAEWPLNRSPRNVFLRLKSSQNVGNLIMHDDEVAPVNIIARWRSSATLAPGGDRTA